MKRLLLFALISIISCKEQYENLFTSNKVKISSIVAGKSLTIKNNTASQVYMEGWKLIHVYNYSTPITTIYTIHNTTLVKGQAITYTVAELGFKPGIMYSQIYLYDNDEKLIDNR